MQSLQSVLNECSKAELDVGFRTRRPRGYQCFQTLEETWQTIVKKIRVAVSKAEVNRRRAVRVVHKRPAAKAASKVGTAASKLGVKKVVSRATANSGAVTR
jgi:hypothetical protein